MGLHFFVSPLGIALASIEDAVEFSKQRVQFGKPIAKNQAIAFKLADMATQIEAARNMLYKACWLREQNKPFQNVSAWNNLISKLITGLWKNSSSRY